MPYNTLIQRTDVDSFIPVNVTNLMLNNLQDTSAALALATRIPMPAGVQRFPVLSALPSAYWVSGDTGLKQTTTMAWDEKTITVEELAAIVPVPENVLDDVDFDIWGAVRPGLETAIARAIDAAVFLDTNNPASFPDGIAVGADAGSLNNKIVRGTATAAQGGVAKDISDLFAIIERQGYSPNAGVAEATLKPIFRNLALVPQQDQIGGGLTESNWFGADIRYPMRGLWPTAVSTVEAIIGDFSQLVIGIRRDFSWKLITEGVITDAAGLVIYNLPQQDMVALRVTFRFGWQIANPINWDQPDPTLRYPFGVLLAPAS